MFWRRLFNWEQRLWQRLFADEGMRSVVVRLSGTMVRGVIGDMIWARAGHMTYLTLLHLVPMGALGLAVSRKLGWESYLASWLRTRLAPAAPEFADRLIAAMERLDMIAVGYIGMAAFLIAGLFALMQLEHDLDDIWGIHASRPVWKSLFLIYPFALGVAPLLVAIALASGALVEAKSRIWIANLAHLGSGGAWLHDHLINLPVIFQIIPYGITWLLLTAIYYLIPSGPVRVRSALFGGVIAGVIWQAAQGIYLNFQFASATFREAWGYLAQIPLLLLWIFLTWFILFLGAEIAFVWQYRYAYMPKWPVSAIPAAEQERALLRIVGALIGYAEKYPEGMTPHRLSNMLQVPWRLAVKLCDDLAEIGACERRRYRRYVRYMAIPGLEDRQTDELVAIWRQHGAAVTSGKKIKVKRRKTAADDDRSVQDPPAVNA